MLGRLTLVVGCRPTTTAVVAGADAGSVTGEPNAAGAGAAYGAVVVAADVGIAASVVLGLPHAADAVVRRDSC